MAEAFARHHGSGVIEPSSTGVWPASIIQPETYQVLQERGVKLQPRPPRNILLEGVDNAELLVNMTGGSVVPLLHRFNGREVLWRIRDPIGQTLDVYRAVRDQIEQKVVDLVEELRKD